MYKTTYMHTYIQTDSHYVHYKHACACYTYNPASWTPPHVSRASDMSSVSFSPQKLHKHKATTCWFSGPRQRPKGPCTAHLRSLVPTPKPGMAFGTRVLKWAVFWEGGSRYHGVCKIRTIYVIFQVHSGSQAQDKGDYRNHGLYHLCGFPGP